MNQVISEILKETKDPESFRASLLKTNGEFDFGIESMIRLGEVYCELYPDSVSHGDSAQVQIGYRIVRISIIEVLLRNMESDLKDLYRDMFTNISTIKSHLAEIVSMFGLEEAVKIHKNLDIKIKEIKFEIDLMESNIIKERFTGGITVFYNILYLMKKTLNIT
ncbi:MAG TPA: hypothetical protein PKG60_01910 [Spirochaetota bacterium]|nr:hypothetical protein [Spirochaetota bacterium]HPS86490.1 hypothetical protein [Spirochaetota bacterium]